MDRLRAGLKGVARAAVIVAMPLVVGCAYKPGTEPASAQRGGWDVTNGIDMTNGIDVTNGADFSNGLDLSNGCDMSNGLDLANGLEVSNGLEMSNGIDVTNGTDLSNGVDLTNGVDFSNGLDFTNGADISNGLQFTNGLDVTNGLDFSNGIDFTNGADLSNGLQISIQGEIGDTGATYTYLQDPDPVKRANHCKIMKYMIQCALGPWDWVRLACAEDAGGLQTVRGALALGRDWATGYFATSVDADPRGLAAYPDERGLTHFSGMSLPSQEKVSACLGARANATTTEGIIVDLRASWTNALNGDPHTTAPIWDPVAGAYFTDTAGGYRTELDVYQNFETVVWGNLFRPLLPPFTGNKRLKICRAPWIVATQWSLPRMCRTWVDGAPNCPGIDAVGPCFGGNFVYPSYPTPVHGVCGGTGANQLRRCSSYDPTSMSFNGCRNTILDNCDGTHPEYLPRWSRFAITTYVKP